MRVAAISDVHGNLPALEAVLAEIEREGADSTVVVGDMQYDRRLSSGLRVVNPGSVGMPYEGAPGAYWALLGPDVDFRRSEYDAVATVAAARVLGAPLDPELASQLVDPPTAEETSAYFESIRAS